MARKRKSSKSEGDDVISADVVLHAANPKDSTEVAVRTDTFSTVSGQKTNVKVVFYSLSKLREKKLRTKSHL